MSSGAVLDDPKTTPPTPDPDARRWLRHRVQIRKIVYSSGHGVFLGFNAGGGKVWSFDATPLPPAAPTFRDETDLKDFLGAATADWPDDASLWEVHQTNADGSAGPDHVANAGLPRWTPGQSAR